MDCGAAGDSAAAGAVPPTGPVVAGGNSATEGAAVEGAAVGGATVEEAGVSDGGGASPEVWDALGAATPTVTRGSKLGGCGVSASTVLASATPTGTITTAARTAILGANFTSPHCLERVRRR